jgi:hypothetical protein
VLIAISKSLHVTARGLSLHIVIALFRFTLFANLFLYLMLASRVVHEQSFLRLSGKGSNLGDR